MLFNSFQFLVFFLAVTAIFFLLPHKYRWFHLLIASCLFYMAFIPIYIFILAFTIIIDYYAGILIENAREENKKRFLYLSIVANVGVLVVFKYYNFFTDNINDVFHLFHLNSVTLPLLKIILPVGLSFHTFQAMSYTIEVYRGNHKAERHFGIYALYVMFYPQLLAGPIERPQHILHQFREEKTFDSSLVVSGIKLMAWGLFKKVVIADRLAILVDPVFANPHVYQPLTVALALLFYAFQVYCDFAGYSDMAIGAARVMGYNLMRNFDRPFTAKSIAEFWRRWHISLSSWLQDYLFTPLSITLRNWGKWGAIFAAMITFTLIGLWHGAGWNFVLFGAVHGFYISFALLTRSFRNKLNTALLLNRNKWFFDRLQVATTFALFLFSLVIFRSPSMQNTFYIWKVLGNTIVQLPGMLIHYHGNIIGTNAPMTYKLILFSVFLILLLEAIEYVNARISISAFVTKQPIHIRWGVYYAIVCVILFAGIFENRQFIYFQF